MIRVISSPSISTTGFTTLIFAMRGASCLSGFAASLRSGTRLRKRSVGEHAAGIHQPGEHGRDPPGESEAERGGKRAFGNRPGELRGADWRGDPRRQRALV